MSEEQRKIALGVEVDASGARQGLGDIKSAAQDMAQGVAQAGQTASKAIDGIGAGAGTAADKLDRTTNNIVGSIQRATAAAQAGTKGTADYYEAIGKLKGADGAVLKPYIDKLREVEVAQKGANAAVGAGAAALDASGLSAKQLSFALRGVPAQFTDIVTSIASGQRPITVLMQQGGQLKDMFGGAGNAARALGGYVLGLINPFTVGAAAVAGLALAYHAGAQESDAYAKALILSGNAAGTNAGQLGVMAANISKVTGTQMAAAEALAIVAQSGKVTRNNLEAVTLSAIQFEKATGQAVGKTVESFAELAKSPLTAALKLDEQYHFLTDSVYKQIRALDLQGNATKAAEVAQKAFADTLASRSDQILQNVGSIEKAWMGVKGAVLGVVDALAGIGRTQGPEQVLASKQDELQRLLDQRASGGFNTTEGGAATGGRDRGAAQRERRIAQLQAETAALGGIVYMRQQTAQQAADEAKQREAVARWDARVLENAPKFEKWKLEEKRIRQEGLDAGKSELEIQKEINREREKFLDNAGASNVAGQRAAKRIAEEENARLLRQINTGDFSGSTKLTSAEQKVIQVQEELKESMKAAARAMKERELAAAQAAVQDEKNTQALQKQAEAVKAAKEAHEKLVIATGAEADKIREQALEQQRANDMFGKSKTAIEQVRLAEMQKQLAEADAFDSFDPRYVASLKAKTDAQKLYVEQLQRAEFLQESRKLDEQARAAGEEAKSLQLEVSLLGIAGLERAKIIAARKVEVQLAKELADIEKLNLGEGPEAAATREELRAKARANAAIESQNAVQKAVLDEWQRTTDQINQSLTDALLRGFEAGKDFAKNFRDTLKNMFQTLVLRPIIQGTLAPVSGALSGVTQSLTGSGGLLGGASSGYNLYNLGGKAADYFGIGGLSSATSAANAGSAALYSSTASYSAAYDSLVAAGAETADAAAMAAEATTSLAAETSVLASIGPAGWVALAAVAAFTIFSGKGGGPKADGRSGTLYSDIGTFDNSLGASLNPAVAGLQSQYAALAKQFGGDAAVSFGLAISRDPKGTAPTFLEIAGTKSGQQLFSNVNTGVGRSDQDLANAISAASTDAIIGALKASNLEQPFADFFNKVAADATQEAKTAALETAKQVGGLRQNLDLLGPVFTKLKSMSIEGANGLILLAGGLQNLVGQLQSFQQNYYSEAERAAQAAKNISLALAGVGLNFTADQITSMTREQFRGLVEFEMGLGDAAAPVLAVLLNVQQAFADLHPAATAAAAAVQQVSTSLADMQKTMYDQTKSGVDNALQVLQRAVDVQRSAVQETIDHVKGVFDAVKQGASELYGEATPGATGGSGRAFIDQSLSAARATGYLPDTGQLQAAISAARAEMNGKVYASQFDLTRDKLVLAGKLSQLQAIAEPQLSAAEQQLKDLDAILSTAQAQVDALRGIDSSVKTVRQALDALALQLAGERAVKDVIATSTPSGASAAGVFNADGSFTVGGVTSTADQLAALRKESNFDNSANLSFLELLGRAPDQSARDWIDSAYASGGTVDQLRQAIMASEEYKRRLPSFDVGTNFVPRNMLAQVHEGEAIVPRAYNPAAGGEAQVNRMIEKLMAKFDQLQAVVEDGNGHQRRTADAVNGNPDQPMVVRTA